MKLMVTVLMLLTLGAEGMVVKDFTDKDTDPACKKIFLNGEPPEFNAATVLPSRYKHICQKYNNKYYYATLYDTTEKIPVYSAYQYKERGDCEVERPHVTWKIEPQLEDQKKGDEMDLQGRMKVNNQQAYNSDYKHSKFNKGHLYPFCHSNTADTAVSTFTLTNAAPQKCDFNNDWYDEVESKVTPILNDCVNQQKTAFVVTGVVPSAGTNKKTLKNEGKVNVPSHFWTAYCCADNNNKCEFGGYIMDAEKKILDKRDKINDFQTELKNLYNIDSVRVFHEAGKKRPRNP